MILTKTLLFVLKFSENPMKFQSEFNLYLISCHFDFHGILKLQK